MKQDLGKYPYLGAFCFHDNWAIPLPTVELLIKNKTKNKRTQKPPKQTNKQKHHPMSTQLNIHSLSIVVPGFVLDVQDVRIDNRTSSLEQCYSSKKIPISYLIMFCVQEEKYVQGSATEVVL